MSTIWHCNKERKRNTHLRVKEASWNMASLLSYLKRCLISPPPHSGVSFWRPDLAFWRLKLTFLLVWESPNPGAVRGRGGGLAWVAIWWAFPQTQELVFWLFLLSFLTSGPFSCWSFLLLKQRFFWYYSRRKVMAILCCVAQKAASAAHLWNLSLYNLLFWNISADKLIVPRRLLFGLHSRE